MIKTPTLLIVSGLLLGVAGCQKAPPANVAATVNDRPITYAELDKAFRSQYGNEAGKSDDDQTRSMKLQTLLALINSEIMLQRAEKQSLMASDSEVEAKFNELKAPYTQEEFARQLTARNLTVEELKTQLRRDLSVQKLINKEITSKISISEKDVTEFYNANKQSFNLAEPQMHMAQIVVTPTPDPTVRNLRSSKAQNEEQARKKMEMIEMRLRQGEDFAMVAQNFSEDTNSAPNGGDLGFIPESALEKVHPELRKIVMGLEPGQASRIIRTPEGYRILKVVSREPAGQRALDDPRVQQHIRETLSNRKDQLLRDAFYEVARSEAKVVNYYAASVVQTAAK
jgi:peptidyl-prolyl cis-trans isomerase SurA